MHINEKEMSAYLDNSLPSEKQERLKDHVTNCTECRRRLNEWESLFDTIGMLSFDFSLDGLEEKVLRMIRNEENKTVAPRVLASYMAYVMAFLFIAGLFISPMIQAAGQLLQAAGNYAAGAGLDFINTVKWYAVDIVSYIENADFISWLFLLVAGITLVAGGTYFSFGSRLRRT